MQNTPQYIIPFYAVMRANAVVVAVNPMNNEHVTGLVHSMLAPLYAGATLVLLTRWDLRSALDTIEKYCATHWINISTMVVDLLSAPDVAERDLGSLVAVSGGAPLPEAVGRKLHELTGLTYVKGYGLTETISQTHFNPPDRAKQADGSLQIPAP